jgi:hypothetical protein
MPRDRSFIRIMILRLVGMITAYYVLFTETLGVAALFAAVCICTVNRRVCTAELTPATPHQVSMFSLAFLSVFISFGIVSTSFALALVFGCLLLFCFGCY